MRSDSNLRIPIIVFFICCVISIPSFFDVYRLLAFNTFPRDDYAPFLLRFTSAHGVWPGSPYGYRVLSVLPAVPFYWALPLYRFSLLPKIDASYLRAVQALAFLHFLSVAGAATVAFEVVSTKIGGSIGEAGLTAALTIIFSGFLGKTGIEPFDVLVIFVLLYILERPLAFSLAVLLTPFVSEKIPMFWLFLMTSRSIFVRDYFSSHKWQAVSSVIAIGLYIAALMIIRLPGNEYQQAGGEYIPRLFDTIKTAVGSLKGIELDLLPTLVITIPCVVFSLYSEQSTEMLAKSDFLVPLGLAIVACAATYPRDFNVGRVTAFAFPLTIIACGSLVRRYDKSLA
jgi:hypothetical protein